MVYNISCGHDLVCVSTEAEYKDRLRKEYGYTKDQVVLTGLPRFDCLEKRKEKILTIGLTWRKNLVKEPENVLLNSVYYAMIESLVVQPDLATLAESYGYKVQIVPHPELDKEFLRIIEECKDERIIFNTYESYRILFPNQL